MSNAGHSNPQPASSSHFDFHRPSSSFKLAALSKSSPAFLNRTTHPPLIRSNGARLARARRPSCSPLAIRWIVGSFFILSYAILLSGTMWLLLGFYASENLEIGRNYSRIYSANSLFVRRIVVTNTVHTEGPVIYGFSATPALNEEIDWTEVHDAVVSGNHHKEWAFWLNKGSRVVLQYNITDPSLELSLVVIQGEENLQKWIQDLNDTLSVYSWKIAQGVGTLQHEVHTDYNYYFALGNKDTSSVKVMLQITVQSKIYNAENYSSLCSLTSSSCAVNVEFLGTDVLLLTTPRTDQNGVKSTKGRFVQQDDGPWTVNIAFEQRWMTYLVFWGLMAIILLIMLKCCRRASQVGETSQESQVTEATPLITSHEVEDKNVELEHPEASSFFPADLDVETNEALEDYLCIICFDAHKNCFFDPCGHSATCYSCSMKILKQKKPLCPLCRQPIRLVRRLFLH